MKQSLRRYEHAIIVWRNCVHIQFVTQVDARRFPTLYNYSYSGVGEGGAGGATASPLLKVGGHCPPTLGHSCTLKDFFMQYVTQPQ